MEFRTRTNAKIASASNTSTPAFGKHFAIKQLSLPGVTQLSPIPHTKTISFLNMQNAGQKTTKHPTTIVMICEAIKTLGPERNGISVQAIKKWITATYASVQESYLKSHLKRALVKALSDGTLVRPSRSKAAVGAVGSFCLPKQPPSKNAVKISAKQKVKSTKKKAPASREMPEDYVSDSEVTINRGRSMSMRLHMSDTELDEVRKSIAFEEKPKRGKKTSVKPKLRIKIEENSKQEKNAAPAGRRAKAPAGKPTERDAAPAKPPRKTKPTAKDKENAAPKEKKPASKATTRQRSKNGN